MMRLVSADCSFFTTGDVGFPTENFPPLEASGGLESTRREAFLSVHSKQGAISRAVAKS
jgi:hypothetical protein